MLSVMCSGILCNAVTVNVFTVSLSALSFVAFLLSRCYHNVVNKDDYKNKKVVDETAHGCNNVQSFADCLAPPL